MTEKELKAAYKQAESIKQKANVLQKMYQLVLYKLDKKTKARNSSGPS